MIYAICAFLTLLLMSELYDILKAKHYHNQATKRPPKDRLGAIPLKDKGEYHD